MYSLSESEAKEYYKLVQVDKRQWKHGPVWQKSFKIDLVKGLPSGHLGLIWLEDIIKSAISQVTSEAKPGLCLFCVFPCELLFLQEHGDNCALKMKSFIRNALVASASL